MSLGDSNMKLALRTTDWRKLLANSPSMKLSESKKERL